MGKNSKRLLAVLMVVLVVLTVLVVLPGMRGWKVLVVVSGSMRPAIPVGSLVYVSPTAPATLSPGEICTWKDTEKGVLVTHRVVQVDATAELLWTKGDANQRTDAPVPFSSVVGKVEKSVPVGGWLILLLRTPAGLLVLCFAAIVAAHFLKEPKDEPEEIRER